MDFLGVYIGEQYEQHVSLLDMIYTPRFMTIGSGTQVILNLRCCIVGITEGEM
jgi:hypothetical protein